jgi:maleylpyruvate isomerase
MSNPDAILYDYFRLTAAYRVRIALELKGLGAQHRFVHLRQGEQTQPSYRAINPAGLVPHWIDGDFELA